MGKTVTITLKFKLGEGRPMQDFVDAADHEMRMLMEDYGDELGEVAISHD